MAIRSPLFDFLDPNDLLAQQAELGLLPGDVDEYGLPKDRRTARVEDLLPPEEQQSLLRRAAAAGASGLAGVGWLLDTPGAMVRGLLSGGPGKAVSALWDTADDRVDGRELMRQYGLLGKKNNWGNFATGLIGEAVLDPLTYLNPLAILGRGALRPAGKVFAKTGLMDDLGLRARRAADMGGREYMQTRTAREALADAAVELRGANRADADEWFARATAAEARDMSPDNPFADIMQRFDRRARGTGRNADELLDQPLASLMEFRLPFTRDGVAIPGGAPVARALDTLGEWSKHNPILGPAVNRGAAWFNPAVQDTIDPTLQMDARRGWENKNVLKRDLREAHGRAIMAAERETAQLGDQTLGFHDQRIQNALRDIRENSHDPALLGSLPDQEAIQLVLNTPGWRQYSDFVPEILERARFLRDNAGLRNRDWESLEGTGYLTRQRHEFDRDMLPVIDTVSGPRAPRPTGPGDRRPRVFATGDNVGIQREDFTDLPGGASTFRRLQGVEGLQDRLIASAPDQAPEILDPILEQFGIRPYRNVQGDFGSLNQLDEAEQVLAGAYGPWLPEHVARRAARTAAPGERAMVLGQAGTEAVRRAAGELEGGQVAMLKRQLADLIRQGDTQFNGNLGYFDNSVVKDIDRYLSGTARSVGNADMIRDRLGRAMVDASPNAIEGGGHVSMRRAAQDLGFNPDRLAEEFGLESLDGMALPEAELRTLRQLTDRGSSTARTALGRFIKTFTNAWKAGVLTTPSYHTRNLYSGITSSAVSGDNYPLMSRLADTFAGWRAGGGNFDAVARRLQGIPGFEDMSPEQIIEEFRAGAARHDLGQGQIMEGANAPNLLVGSRNEQSIRWYDPERSWGDFFTTRGINWPGIFTGTKAPPRTLNPAMQLNERVGRSVEDANRLGAYISELRQGAHPDAAAAQVFKTQVDYSPEAYTSFEQRLKEFFPFYSFTRGIAPSVVENMMYRPGGAQGQMIRAMSRAQTPGEDQFLPEHLRKSGSIQLPGKYGKEENLARVLTNIDTPFASLLNLIGTGDGGTLYDKGTDALQKTLLNVAGMAHPLIKAPIEMLLDRQLYSGREMSDLYSPLEDRLGLGVPGRHAEQVLANIPGMGQVMSILRTATDPRLTALEKATKVGVNKTLGVKFSDFDPKQAMSKGGRNAIEDVLRNIPGAQTYESLNIPEEALSQLSKSQLEQYALYRAMQAKASREAREKKKREMDPIEILMGSR